VFSNDPGAGVSSLFDAAAAPAWPRPGVYARGVHTRSILSAQLLKVSGGQRCVPGVGPIICN
jgi:hypothetical protein